MKTINSFLDRGFTVTELGEFLKNPPGGFTVETPNFGGYRVHSDPQQSLVLIDGLRSCRGAIVFTGSLGRAVKMQTLSEYTCMRKNLLTKRIYLLVSACRKNSQQANKEAPRVLQQFIVSINGSDPVIRWQMERGLDWIISSVAGESYSLNIDFTEYMESWGAMNFRADGEDKLTPVWRDACFTFKYHSDALFDFPFWFGFNKRTFNFCQISSN